MEIIIPSIKEAKAALGSDAHSFTREYLSDRRLPDLISALKDPELDIDDRFNCALELRSRSLAESSAGQAAINSLFTLVENSTKPTRADGAPGFTVEEKRVGIMAAIALQGSISDSPIYLSITAQWLESGIKALHIARQIEEMKDGGLPADLSSKEIIQWHNEVMTNEEHTHQAYRALVILAGTTDDRMVSHACSILRHRLLPDSFKVFAINALTGVSNEKHSSEIALAFGLALSDLRSSEWLRTQVLQSWSIFRPRNEIVDAIISQMHEGLEQMIVSASLELDHTTVALGGNLLQAVKQAQSPRFSPEQAEEARRYIGAEVWRPIVHLKDLDSILLPDPFTNLLHEILPADHRRIVSL